MAMKGRKAAARHRQFLTESPISLMFQKAATG